MLRTLHSNLKVVQHVAAAVKTATVTPSNGVDLRGFDAVEFLIAIGTITNIAQSPTPTWKFKLQDSADDVTFADVTDSKVVLTGSAKSPVAAPDGSTGIFLTVDAAAEDDQVYRVGYIGTKRYVRLVSTAASTPGNTPLAVIAVLGLPNIAPTAD
jgi:hypothetical protein